MKNKYYYIGKNVFIDKYKRPDVNKNHKKFLKIIKKLGLYFIEFNKINEIIPKIYPTDCKIRRDQHWPIIVIIYNKCIFLSNDGSYFM